MGRVGRTVALAAVGGLIATSCGSDSDEAGNDAGDLTPEWGLHIVAANVAMGDLLGAVDAQISTFGGG